MRGREEKRQVGMKICMNERKREEETSGYENMNKRKREEEASYYKMTGRKEKEEHKSKDVKILVFTKISSQELCE